MAHSLSAKKRIRQNINRRARNRWRLKRMRGAIKAFNQRLSSGQLQEAGEAYRKAASEIDRTAQRGVIHKNQAARRKSRLSARLKARKHQSA